MLHWGTSLKGNCTPNQKLACFVLYLKIINSFLKNVSYSKLSKELKKQTNKQTKQKQNKKKH